MLKQPVVLAFFRSGVVVAECGCGYWNFEFKSYLFSNLKLRRSMSMAGCACLVVATSFDGQVQPVVRCARLVDCAAGRRLCSLALSRWRLIKLLALSSSTIAWLCLLSLWWLIKMKNRIDKVMLFSYSGLDFF